MQLSARILDGLIAKNDNILVGVSGGADSMCLLALLLEQKKNIDFNLLAVHVNHNIRDEEAKRDEDFVCSFCKKHNVNCKVVHVQAKKYAQDNNKSVEQAGRELRYEAFDKLIKEEKFNKLFVAHHKDDQAETIIMHIARGSSLKGARGMSKQSKSIVRPLLNFTRDEILAYNKERGIAFVEDSTNNDTNYTRNFIRKEILPRLETVYPNVKNALCLFASFCSRDDDFIESLLPNNLLKQEKDQVRILSGVENLNISLSSRLIKRAFEMLGVFADIEEKHINQILELFTLKNGSKIILPSSLVAYKEYDGVVLTKKKRVRGLDKHAFTLGEVEFKGYGKIYALDITNKQEIEFGDGNHYVDYNKIPAKAVWRTRQDGDVFAKLGTGSKKLNDYFTDKKVPARYRDNIPVLAVDNKILLVAGLDISEGVKLTSSSEQIVKIIYIPSYK